MRSWAAAGRLLAIKAHKKSSIVMCLVERMFAFLFVFNVKTRDS
jgi:hypothetical protein